MYRIAARERKALLESQRTYVKINFGNYRLFGRDLVGSKRSLISRHYASGSRGFTRRVASKLLWTAGVVAISGGAISMVRCALIRIFSTLETHCLSFCHSLQLDAHSF